MSGNIPCFQSPRTNTLPESTQLVHKYILSSFVADKVNSARSAALTNQLEERQQVLCRWTWSKEGQNQAGSASQSTSIELRRRGSGQGVCTPRPQPSHHTLICVVLHDQEVAPLHMGATNTGVPQGFELSPPLFSSIKHDRVASHISDAFALFPVPQTSHQRGPGLDSSRQRHHRNSFPHSLRTHGLQDPLPRATLTGCVTTWHSICPRLNRRSPTHGGKSF